jgi:dTDP-4-amino-4,6-dideoxygalactose transaminase
MPKGIQASEDLPSFLSRIEHRGVQCRKPVFRPLHRYLDLHEFPVSDEVDQTAISLPIHPSMTEEDVTRVVHILTEELQ